MVQVIQQSPQKNWKEERSKKTEKVLQELTGVSKEQEAAKLAASVGLPYIDLQIFPVANQDIINIPKEDAKRLRLVLFEKTGPKICVAFSDPSNQEARAYVNTLAGEREWDVKNYVVSDASLEKAWATYENAPMLENFDLWRVSLQGEELKQFEENFKDLLSLKKSEGFPISQTIEIILAGANKLRASDIHIEPFETDVRLRYRIDGVLQEVGMIPAGVYKLALSRVKMLSHMKINVRDRAQDGHFSVELEEKRIDIRVNIIPGNHGENINMRILNTDDAILDVEDLGITGATYEKIINAIKKPHGMIINTGPTGSGKTTTIYSLIHMLNTPDVKIITIEDPIEYQIPGIVQTEVSKDHSYTFGTALRAIVRQDPDIILVGEIRDEETADVAINAAITGHLLFSTIHANSAPGAIPRFFEMGVKPSLIASALNIVIGQRLVRQLCEYCKESYEPAKETTDSLFRLLSLVSPKAKVKVPKEIKELWKPKGCARCNMTGYHGRIGIFEIFSVSKKIEEIIFNLGTEKEIAEAAIEDGMVTMLQDGILKTFKGQTTMEEVWRATGQEDFLNELYESFYKKKENEATREKPAESEGI